MSRIPKQELSEKSDRIPKPSKSQDRKINFSFEMLDFNKYFSLNGTCVNWSYDLLCMMRDISRICLQDLVSGKYPTYRYHKHKNVNPPVSWPQNINPLDVGQIRISKSKGGIHGVFVENVFYVLWLDPLHNMYPDKRYGGLRVVVPPKNCCTEKDDIIEKLNKEIQEYEDLLDEKTKS